MNNDQKRLLLALIRAQQSLIDYVEEDVLPTGTKSELLELERRMQEAQAAFDSLKKHHGTYGITTWGMGT
jgi:hypothetical protein